MVDVMDPNVQTAIHQADEAVKIWESHFPHCKFVGTDKQGYSELDGVLVINGTIVRVVEIKGRKVPLDDFRSKFKSQWLVSESKLSKCQTVAEVLRVPFVGFLHLVIDQAVLCKTLWRPKDGWVCDRDVRLVKTKKDLYGGEKEVPCAFLDMSDALELRIKTNGQ